MPAAGAFIKSFENMRQIFGGDTRPIVRNGDEYAAVFSAAGQKNAALRIPKGVGNQVPEQLLRVLFPNREEDGVFVERIAEINPSAFCLRALLRDTE